MKVTKQRDAEDRQEFGFNLKVVELGKDCDGDIVTSCTILQAEIDPKSRSAGGKNQRAVQNMFTNFLAEKGVHSPHLPGFPEPGRYRIVDLEEFIDFGAGRMTGTNARKAVRRAVSGLVERNILGLNGGKLWYIG